MSERSDHSLLQSFAASGNEESFRVLVGRYSGFIYRTAMRRLGNAGDAQEIAQDVFAALARKAARLDARGSLAAWLHRAAMLAILDRLRRGRRRAAHYEEYQRTMQPEARDPMESVRPHLDEALEHLRAADRELLLLHFAERLTFQQIAARHGGSADAARMRATRAIESLAAMLRSKGVTIPAVALGVGLSSAFSQTAPTALAAALTPAALAGAGKVSATTVIMHAFQTIKTVQLSAAAALLLAVSVPLWWQHSQIVEARARVDQGAGTRVSLLPEIAPPGEGATPAATASLLVSQPVVDIRELARQARLASRRDGFAAFRLNATLNSLDAAQLAALAETVWSNGLLPRMRDELTAHLFQRLRKFDLAATVQLGHRLLAAAPEVDGNAPPMEYPRNRLTTPAGEVRAAMFEWTMSNPTAAREWFDREIGADFSGDFNRAIRRLFISGLLEKDLPVAMKYLHESSVDEILATLDKSRWHVALGRPAVDALTDWARATFSGEESVFHPLDVFSPDWLDADGAVTKRSFLYGVMRNLHRTPGFPGNAAQYLQTMSDDPATTAFLAARYAFDPNWVMEFLKSSKPDGTWQMEMPPDLEERILERQMQVFHEITPAELLPAACAHGVAMIATPNDNLDDHRKDAHLSARGGKLLEAFLATEPDDGQLSAFATSEAFALARWEMANSDVPHFSSPHDDYLRGRVSEAQASAAVRIRDAVQRRAVLARILEMQWPASAWMLRSSDIAREDRAAFAAKNAEVSP